MKKILFVCFMIFALSFLWSCTPEKENKSVRTIHGKAAIGAYIEEGAQVQVRPASVDGVNPADLIEGTVGADGYYEVIIPEEIPVESEEIITKGSKADGDTGNGFIIRAWSESSGSWIYSYAENDSADITANVNPYTDMFVRCFYNPSMVDQSRINNYFPTGTFSDGSVMTLPDATFVLRVMDVMSKMLYTVWSMDNIQNFLIDTWEVDQGLDELINNLGLGVNAFLYSEYFYIIQKPYIFNNASAIADEESKNITIDIWTDYGNTGDVTATATDLHGVTYSAVMVKQPDSTESENHFKVTLGTWEYFFQSEYVYVSISDYNGGLGNRIVVKKP
jgi:hypothetical protein